MALIGGHFFCLRLFGRKKKDMTERCSIKTYGQNLNKVFFIKAERNLPDDMMPAIESWQHLSHRLLYDPLADAEGFFDGRFSQCRSGWK